MIAMPIVGSTALNRQIHVLHSLLLTENAGTPAVARVQFKDNDGNGALWADIRLAASETRHITFDPPMSFPSGLYVQVSAGTVRGTIMGE